MKRFLLLVLLAIFLPLLPSRAALAGPFTFEVSILLHALKVRPGETARLEGLLFVAGDPQTIIFTPTNLDPGITVSFGNTSVELPYKDHTEVEVTAGT